MFKHHIFYNPIAGSGSRLDEIRALAARQDGATLYDITKTDSLRRICENLDTSDKLTICGGDGTLNRFLNDTRGVDFPCDVYYYPSGTGNDFMREYAEREGCSCDTEQIRAVKINAYIKDLPTTTVFSDDGERDFCFINGVGFGVDGYCCETGDAMRAAGAEKINYTSIAVKGLLFHYKPTGATVTVDGKSYRFEKVWIAPTMKGKYYGGGIMPTPDQDRFDGELSVLVFHGTGRLKTLMLFPKLFKGEHVSCEKYITILKGKEVTVEYDSPRPLQVDGETVKNVISYKASAKCAVKA